MDIILKHFSEVKKIKFDPYDIITEAAFGESTVDEIISFIKKYDKEKRNYIIKELKDASEITLDNSTNEYELKGAKIVKEALSKL